MNSSHVISRIIFIIIIIFEFERIIRLFIGTRSH